jgi:hypothetical protein
MFLLAATPAIVDSNRIDFSILDTVSGAIAGMVVAVIVFFVVGGILLKYGIIRIGSNPGNGLPPCDSPSTRCIDHSGVSKDLSFLAGECKSIWGEIKDVNARQISLRERLPKEYVSREDLGEIKGRLKSIDDKLDSYLRMRIGGE